MPIWKTTENIIHLEKDGEFFDENWMNYDRVSQYAPKPVPWKEDRPIRFEDVDLWEVISECSSPFGFTGVYAAYVPYDEYYVVTQGWKIIAEFEGWMANERLEQFLIQNNIYYPKSNKSTTPLKNKTVEKKLVLPTNFLK
jgi:hypothetical protein